MFQGWIEQFESLRGVTVASSNYRGEAALLIQRNVCLRRRGYELRNGFDNALTDVILFKKKEECDDFSDTPVCSEDQVGRAGESIRLANRNISPLCTSADEMFQSGLV